MFTMFTVITMIIMFPLFIMFQVKQRHLGKGTMLTASFRRSALSWPGNLRQVDYVLRVAARADLILRKFSLLVLVGHTLDPVAHINVMG